VAWAQRQRAILSSLLESLHAAPDQALDVVERLLTEHKRLARDLSQLKVKLAAGSGTADVEVVDVAGVKLARRKVTGLDKAALRDLADSLMGRLRSGIVVLASATDGRVQVVVAVTPDLARRVNAGQVVKRIAPIVGGGGGGRPDFAEAGGRQPERIDEMLDESVSVVESLLKAS
jgi:alanyl-tRNA synthetase